MRTKTNLVLMCLVLLSCNVPDIISLPHQDPKLVLNCIGESGQNWQARLYLSRDVLDEFNRQGPPAGTIAIYENDEFMENLPLKAAHPYDGSWYISDANHPSPGKKYSVVVSVPGFETVTSSFVQPNAVQPELLTVTDLGPSTVFPGMRNVRFRIGFTDPPGENFYEVYVQGKPTAEANATFHFGAMSFTDPAFKEYNNVFYQATAFKDSFFEGKKVELDFDAISPGESFLWPENFDPELRSYTVHLNNMSKEYYEYLRSVSVQIRAGNDAFAQPVLIENNINRGYGIFGGFTKASKTIEITK